MFGASLDDAICVLDLAEAIGAVEFSDRSAHRHTATVVNMPAAGVTGPAWEGRTSTYVQGTDTYDAVHFHDDDLEDSDWDAAFELAIPSDTTSGVYAARLTTSDCQDIVPFFVTAPGSPQNTIAFLAPTLTYLAYANEHEALSFPPSFTSFTGRDLSEVVLTWRDWYAVEQGLVSLYDVHRDGSTVSYASTRRPLVNVRPDYTWPLIDGPHGLALDLRLMGWMERTGFGLDLLTDHDLHEAGAAAVIPYRVLVLGAHPEYWTGAMLDALESYLDNGGRVVYPGGNGLFWVTGIDSQRPHVAEVRRTVVGSRPSRQHRVRRG